MLLATADRWRPQLEEWMPSEDVDLGAGRAIRIPSGPPIPCAHCHGQRRIYEPGPLGLCPVWCGRCHGSGWDPS